MTYLAAYLAVAFGIAAWCRFFQLEGKDALAMTALLMLWPLSISYVLIAEYFDP